MSSDFVTAAKMYEELIKVCPDNDEYKMNYAQALYKAALYPEATRAAVRVDNPQYAQKMLMLQVFLLLLRHEIFSRG
jgi:tetratricopeptide repeat protein 30